MAISLYRKYRPQTFDQVVGQQAIEKTLRNAVADGTASHAYLFCGPRGTGKTTTARLLAKALLCEDGPTADPCGKCGQCESVAQGTHPDVYELDAASRTGVDNVREEIIGRVAFAPTRGRAKVYIIDEVHMLSIAAFNALLKTLEEPPDHIVFILCTTDPQRVPETIISRCQRFDFHRIPVPEIAGNLRMICDKEGFTATDEALEMIARQSRGGMRDAISTLEQLAVFGGGSVTAQDVEGLLGSVGNERLDVLITLISRRDAAGCFAWVADFVESGTDVSLLVAELTQTFRNLFVLALTNGSASLESLEPERKSQLQSLSLLFEGPERLARILTMLGDLSSELRTATDSRLCLEIALTRIARPQSELTLEALAERIERLERQGVRAAQTVRATQEAPEQQKTPKEALADLSRLAEEQASEQAEQVLAPASDASQAAATVETSDLSQTHEKTAQTVEEPQHVGGGQVESEQAVQLDDRAALRYWRAVCRDVSQRNKALSGALMSVEARLDGEGKLLVCIPQEAAFTKQVIERPQNLSLLNECVDVAFGHHLEVAVLVEDTPRAVPVMPVEELPSHDLFENVPAFDDQPSAGEGDKAPQEDEPAPWEDGSAEGEEEEEYEFDEAQAGFDEGQPDFYEEEPSSYEYGAQPDEPTHSAQPDAPIRPVRPDAPAHGTQGEDLAEGEMPAEMRDMILGSFSKRNKE